MNGINNIFNLTDSQNDIREVSSRSDEINPKKRTKISDFDAPVITNNFNFEELLPEMKLEVIYRLDEVSFISFSLISKAYHEKYYKPFNPHRFNVKCAKYGYTKLLKFILQNAPLDKYAALSAVENGQLEIFQMFNIIPLVSRPRGKSIYILERFMNTAAKTNNLPILEWIGAQIHTYAPGSRTLNCSYSQSLILGGYIDLFYKHIEYLIQPIEHNKLISAFIENGNLNALLRYLEYIEKNDAFKPNNDTYKYILHRSLFYGKFEIAQKFITQLPPLHQEDIQRAYFMIKNNEIIEILYEHSTDQGKALLLERIKKFGIVKGWTDFIEFFVKKGGRLAPEDLYKTLARDSGIIDLKLVQYVHSNLNLINRPTFSLPFVTKELINWLQQNGYNFTLDKSLVFDEKSRKALMETVNCMMDSKIITQELFEMAIYLCDTVLLEKLWKEKEMLIFDGVLINFIERMNNIISEYSLDEKDWTPPLWIKPHYETIKWLLNKGFKWDISNHHAKHVYNDFIEYFQPQYPSLVKEIISIAFKSAENSQ